MKMGAPKGNKFGKQFTKANASEMGKRKKGKISIRKQVEIVLAQFNDGEFPTKIEATKKVIQNMIEALYSPDPKIRFLATQNFGDYFVAKKREHSGEMGNKVNVAIIYSETTPNQKESEE
jgi:hypothetical protein